MFDDLNNFLKKNYSWFNDLHYVVRAVIFAMVTTVIGALIVTLFSGAATSYYMLYLGVKPPVEGIDAVRSAVFAWVLMPSLFVFAGLSVVLVILIGFAKTEMSKRIVFYFGLLALLASYIYILTLLFMPQNFEAMLKRAKIGGFTPIVLYENLNDKTEVKHECQLVLQSGDAVICYFTATKVFTKFPIGNIQRFDYVSE